MSEHNAGRRKVIAGGLALGVGALCSANKAAAFVSQIAVDGHFIRLTGDLKRNAAAFDAASRRLREGDSMHRQWVLSYYWLIEAADAIHEARTGNEPGERPARALASQVLSPIEARVREDWSVIRGLSELNRFASHQLLITRLAMAEHVNRRGDVELTDIRAWWRSEPRRRLLLSQFYGLVEYILRMESPTPGDRRLRLRAARLHHGPLSFVERNGQYGLWLAS